MSDPTEAANEVINNCVAGDGAVEPQQLGGTIPSSVGNTASGLKPLLASGAHEPYPHPLQNLGAGTNPVYPVSTLPGSPAHGTVRDLDALLRESASPAARSPHTPRSPFSAKPSMAPPSPEAAAASQLQLQLQHSLSSGSLEHLFGKKPLLPHSLSCSSFPFGFTSQFPSASPEPFATIPVSSGVAFRQQRLPSPLSAAGQSGTEAPAQWISAVLPQRLLRGTNRSSPAPACTLPHSPPRKSVPTTLAGGTAQRHRIVQAQAASQAAQSRPP